MAEELRPESALVGLTGVCSDCAARWLALINALL